MREYDFNGERVVAADDALYRVVETLEDPDREDVTDGDVYIYNDRVTQFDWTLGGDWVEVIYVNIHSDFGEYIKQGESVGEVRRLERVVPSDTEICPECGTGWIPMRDDSSQFCLDCGESWDSPEEVREVLE